VVGIVEVAVVAVVVEAMEVGIETTSIDHHEGSPGPTIDHHVTRRLFIT
jgi:hypothetical protein